VPRHARGRPVAVRTIHPAKHRYDPLKGEFARMTEQRCRADPCPTARQSLAHPVVVFSRERRAPARHTAEQGQAGAWRSRGLSAV